MLKSLAKFVGIVTLAFTILSLGMIWMQSRRVAGPDGSFGPSPDPVQEIFAEDWQA